MDIRKATIRDAKEIQQIYLDAFATDEGDRVCRLAIDLLADQTKPETLSLIAEIDNAVVGHIAFSPVAIEGKKNFRGYILAPLAVAPFFQERGIGTKLIQAGLQQLSLMGVHVVFVYGDPNYYNRFGFSVGAAQRYSTPYKLQYPHGWQAIVLNEWVAEKFPVSVRCVKALCDPLLW